MLARPVSRHSDLNGFVIFIAVLLGLVSIAVFGLTDMKVQVWLVQLEIVFLLALWLVPRAIGREPSMTMKFLIVALIVKILGSLLRYWVMVSIYGGGDAIGYDGFGHHNYQLVRDLDFSFVKAPYPGTRFINYVTAFTYALFGESIMGGFLLFALFSFIGMWFFYRAFVLAYPEGNHRLYAIGLFLLPSMWFWPSALGKDAIIIGFLGISTYAVARILTRLSFRPFLSLFIGVFGTYLVRPPIALMILAAGTVAYLLRPPRTRSIWARPLALIVIGPMLLWGSWNAFIRTTQYLGIEGSPTSTFQYYETQKEKLSKGGSQFTTPIPTTPLGAIQAGFTAVFRPFPWEIGSPLGLLAGAESAAIFFFILVRRSQIAEAFRRRSGMTIFLILMTGLLTLALTGFTNFGLLVRQRASLLPFLLMIPAAMPKRVKGEDDEALLELSRA